MKAFDIGPYALPNCAPGEVRFEEPRDIVKVVARFSGGVPANLGLSYQQKKWPGIRLEEARAGDDPFTFGWIPADDWFSGEWRRAEIVVRKKADTTVEISFRRLSAEKDLPGQPAGYDVEFRRTMGIRFLIDDPAALRDVKVFTVSPPRRSVLNIRLDAGQKTPGAITGFYGYNAEVTRVSGTKKRSFRLQVRHMEPVHHYGGDEGLVTFVLAGDPFTVSLASIEKQGPVWFAEKGIFVAADDTTFEEYREQNQADKTLLDRVAALKEQSLNAALCGQPRPHPTNFALGCKLAWQKFWLESNGDVCLHSWHLVALKSSEQSKFKNSKEAAWPPVAARFFFGLERWKCDSRRSDPAPVLAYTVQVQRDAIRLEQKVFAVPLKYSILARESEGSDEIVLCMKFTLVNSGADPAIAELPVHYSQASARSINNAVPASALDVLTAKNGGLFSDFEGAPVLRCSHDTGMECVQKGKGVTFRKELRPGESCELLLKIPYVALETPADLALLASLDFNTCYREVTEYWLKEGAKGAQIRTPEPRLDALYKAHYPYVSLTDFKMADGLVNTSVGTCTYGNFPSEACMIIQELDERGLHEEARRRLDLFIKYQGTASQPGNFTDFDGMYFGCAGLEQGSYNQHHGWTLWCLCEHYFLSHDTDWFQRSAASVVKGADWIFRQRKNTLQPLPHSRGWERGFLPAGSLEDVTDFCYWLSTNVLSWRGAEWAARALKEIAHPEAGRIRKEADAYRNDLVRGFETMRQHAPLVRLRSGEWIPRYPSRAYCRGRAIGWLREVLEGSVYLLISGLYKPDSKAARWILNDLQDNLYSLPPYGYLIPDFERNWFNRAGFSAQPNLLAGLLPHLERDEPEIYIWMFFNAWASCYREEISAMIEHPSPVLGYSNATAVKTSDEANAVMWLRYMLVWANDGLLHFGRALPREWFRDGETIRAAGVATRYGTAGVAYRSEIGKGRITAEVELALHRNPEKALVRFRHPGKLKIKSASVNGKRAAGFNALKGDVDITGLSGTVGVEVNY